MGPSFLLGTTCGGGPNITFRVGQYAKAATVHSPVEVLTTLSQVLTKTGWWWVWEQSTAESQGVVDSILVTSVVAQNNMPKYVYKNTHHDNGGRGVDMA